MITLGMALSGVLYGLVVYPESPLIIGAVFAAFMGVPIIAFERRLLLRPLSRRIERLPTPVFIVSALVIYEVLMSAGYALAAILLWGLDFIKPKSLADIVVMPFHVFLYALAVCALIVFILRVRDLLGHDVFTSMLISRYRAPVKEERVFLFIDLADSTSFAEKHGDLRAQQFLKALFAAFAEPVRRHKGAIDDYIGDAAIVTWPLEKGVKHARCIRCIFDILDDIEADTGLAQAVRPGATAAGRPSWRIDHHSGNRRRSPQDRLFWRHGEHDGAAGILVQDAEQAGADLDRACRKDQASGHGRDRGSRQPRGQGARPDARRHGTEITDKDRGGRRDIRSADSGRIAPAGAA